MELKTYFVAYIDILGFKSIVEKEKTVALKAIY